MKVAITHDWLTNLGGAERVVDTLHHHYCEAPIFTSVYNKSLPILKNAQIKTSFLQKWPLSKTHHQYYPLLRSIAFESFDFSKYDVVISSSSAEAKGIITSTETFHMAYIHTPTRYYWSGYNDYIQNPGFGVLDPVVRNLLPKLVNKLRYWDFAAAQRADLLVANSETVKKRISKYYKRGSTVIYPPVDIKRFENKLPNDKGYYLVVSRLIPYKRVDLAIKACNQLSKNLKVVGQGSQASYLKSIAGPTVEFIENASDAEVTELYLNAKALLFTAYEDFGITPVEAMAASKPVIAYGHGGASESVIDKKTGILFDKQTTHSLAGAIQNFEESKFDFEVIAKHAEKFSSDRFINQISELIKKHVKIND